MAECDIQRLLRRSPKVMCPGCHVEMTLRDLYARQRQGCADRHRCPKKRDRHSARVQSAKWPSALSSSERSASSFFTEMHWERGHAAALVVSVQRRQAQHDLQ